MKLRMAEEKDADRILELLSQILKLHVTIRPDLFKADTIKYTRDELIETMRTGKIYVAADDKDRTIAYAICVLRDQKAQHNRKNRPTLFLDDLCVDEVFQGQGVGTALFGFVAEEAKRLGCSDLVLNVWEGNERAMAFYRKMGMKVRQMQMELQF